CKGVQLCGLVGEDRHAEHLRELLAEELISTDALVSDFGRSTIVKTRIVARQQQVVRVDRERRAMVSSEVLDRACAIIADLLPTVDALIFEDYGKGFLGQALKDRVTEMARAAGKYVSADPNPTNPLDWCGVNLLKPNRSEAFAMAGISDAGAAPDPLTDAPLLKVGCVLLEKWNLPALLVTLGEHGMILFQRGETPYHTPTRAREVFDVSGAGDTAIALYTLAICAGATPYEAAEISNHASGVVVAKLGTATLTAQELLEAFSKNV
ncbi:MAG: carbohydrate kinase, partial [Proteobacteria bacterium]|nr:carbohydrate kinase [Pseudomonadota bacterium]